MGGPKKRKEISSNGSIQASPEKDLSFRSNWSQKRIKKKHPQPTNASSTSNPSIRIDSHDHDEILALLQSIDWNKAQNTSRRNVIRVDDPKTPKNSRNKPYCMSFIFGRNMKDPTQSLSYWSIQYPQIYAKFQSLLQKYDPSFTYTHITVNRNLRCKKHTDGGNAGPSYIAAFGSFRGGQLSIEPPGGGKPEIRLDLKSNFVKFNGKTQPHETMPFEGERFTLVYYTSEMEAVGTNNRRIPPQEEQPQVAPISSSLANKFKEIKAKLGKRKSSM
jgi:hypothetical protein